MLSSKDTMVMVAVIRMHGKIAEFMCTQESSTATLENRKSENFRVRVARIVSNVISPPLVFAIMGFVLAWSVMPFLPGLVWGAIYGFFISLVPLLVVIYMWQTGRVKDLHISDTRQRRIPYLVGVSGAVIMYGLIRWVEGPSILGMLAMANVIGLGVLGIVNQFWLISNHMASITSAVILIGVVFTPVIGLAFAPLIGLVYYSRCILGRHTTGQLWAGMLVGVGSILLVATMGVFS